MEERPHQKQRIAEYSHNQANGNSRQHNGDVYQFSGQAEEQHSQTQKAIGHLSEETGTRIDYITKVLSSSTDRDKVERFLDRLQFDGVTLRREAVSDAAAGTFAWVLDADIAQSAPGWPEYVQRMPLSTWLQEGCEKDLFWILGKAGSGKSTMMKFICDDDRTYELLRRWAGDSRTLVTAQHFFWHPGSPLQKSTEGLLRGLLHQVCQAVPGLIHVVFPTRWQFGFSKPWNVRELWEAIYRLRDLGTNFFFCFYIDGLDECNPPEQHQDLIKRLLELVSGPNIKICVSSRPRPIFESSLDKITDRKLVLEELNYEDLRRYSAEQISDAADLASSYRNIEQYEIDYLAGQVASSASGVFLWVRLVVSSISERIIQGTDYQGLMNCLREFPAELEDYFRQMVFERIHSTWRRSADVAKAFKLAICARELSNRDSEHFHLGSHIDWKYYHVVLETCQTDSIDDLLSTRTVFLSSVDLTMKEVALGRKLDAITGGLLTLTNGLVDFSHRTVYEFLATRDMQVLINENVPVGYHDSTWIGRILIARQKMQLERSQGSGAYDAIRKALLLLRLDFGTHCGKSLLYEALAQVAIDLLFSQYNRTSQPLKDLYGPRESYPPATVSRLSDSFLRESCFSLATEVIPRWPNLLADNRLVWQAALGLHDRDKDELSLEALNLEFLRLILSHGADPRVGHDAFAQFISSVQSADMNRLSYPKSQNKVERLLYQISYALLNDGASPTVTQSYPAGNDRMNATDFAHLCDTTIIPKLTSANSPQDKAKQDGIATRRSSVRARLWNPVTAKTSSFPLGPAHAVWVEDWQRERWAIGVHANVHTIRGILQEAFRTEIADLALFGGGVGPEQYRVLDVQGDNG